MVRVGWRSRAVRAAWAVACAALVMGLVTTARAEAPAAPAASPAPAAPTQATAASIGLLPIHAIAVDLDALPGPKNDKKKNDLAPLQQLWDSYLKGAGFNVVEFDVDVHDLGDDGAGRVARLCAWAKQNDVRIAPTLIGAPEGKPLPADYANLAAAFVGKVIADLGSAGLPSYSQVVFYQLDRPLNHPASHGAMEPSAAGALLKAAAENVRAAEQAGLTPAGLQPTPLLVPSSFDYELIRRGAIARTAISDESYTQAYAGLHDYLLAVLGAAPVEAASVQWFPGSLSSDGVDRLADLVNRLEGDLPGKLLIVDTGYSSAAGSDTAQARYYQVALNNLCDLRANQGVDSPFAGILWRSAFDVGSGDAKPAASPAAGDVAKMWDDPKQDAREARSWLNSIQSHFGLLARANGSSQGLVPKTAYRIMSGLEAALSQSPQASDALAAVKELGAASKTGGVGQAVKSRLQTALFGMLDAWLSKTADNLFETPSEQPAQTPGQPQPRPDITIFGLGDVPNTVKQFTPVVVTVTLLNNGSALATDATVYLRDGEHHDLAFTNPVAVSPLGQTSVTLTWTPNTSGPVKGVSVDAFCSNDADPSTNSNQARIGTVMVTAADKPPKPPLHIGDFGALGDRAVLVSSASSSTPAPTSSGGSVSTGGTRTMMATSSASGFARIEGLSAPKVMMAPAPTSPSPSGSTTTTRSMTGTTSTTAPVGGAPRSAPAPTGGTTPMMGRPTTPATTSAPPPPPPPPPPTPVTMTLANPFDSPFRSVVATLRIDNAVVSRRDLGTLLPHQRRTVTFSEWAPPRPGTYQLRADLDGVGVTGNPLTSSASSTITIAGAGAAPSITPAPETGTRSMTGTRAFTPLVAAVSSQPVRGFGGPSRGFGLGGVRSLMAASVLGLNANSIQIQPFPPAVGTPIAISVQLSNLTRTPANGARVAVSIDGEPLGETVTNVPASGTVMASGFRDWSPKPGRHDVRATVTLAAEHGEAVKPFIVTGQGGRGFERPGFVAGGGFKPGFGKPAMPPGQAGRQPGFQPGFKPMVPGRPGTGGAGAPASPVDLQIATTDIRFTPPMPASGAAITVSIAVHNLGTTPVSEAQVLAILTAAGAEVARKTFPASIPAGGVASLEWPLTAPTGTPIVVSVTATAAGDANPANNQARATAAGKPAIRPVPRAFGTTP